MEAVIRIALRLLGWVELQASPREEEADDAQELLERQHIRVYRRTRKNRQGQSETVLYVPSADRDLARYCTGWRIGGS